MMNGRPPELIAATILTAEIIHCEIETMSHPFLIFKLSFVIFVSKIHQMIFASQVMVHVRADWSTNTL